MAIVAPRCDAGSSKNCNTSGWPFERLLHDAALYALAAAVNQPHLSQARGVCGVDILLDDRLDVARREGVEVERVLDGNPSGCRQRRRGS